MLACITALAAAFVVKAVVFAFFGLHLFGWMNIIYLDAVVVTPLAALAVLVATRRRRIAPARRATRPVRALACVCLLLPALGVYGTFIEPRRLVLEQASVPLEALRAGHEPIRVAVLADLQTDRIASHEHAAIDRIMNEQPDLILMPGDLLQGSKELIERERPALRQLLGRLAAPGGVWFVGGDCERMPGWPALFEGTPVRVLNNERVDVVVRDRRITLAGVELNYGSAAAVKTIRELEQARGDADIRILLAHRPDVVAQLAGSSRIDLVVAGHTHGGQIVIPGFGPPVTFSHLPRHVCAGGLHDLLGNRLYISRGVGMERGQAPRIRLFCPPEVSLLTLQNAQ